MRLRRGVLSPGRLLAALFCVSVFLMTAVTFAPVEYMHLSEFPQHHLTRQSEKPHQRLDPLQYSERTHSMYGMSGGMEKSGLSDVHLSIIILTFNNAPLVNRTLHTLLQQSHTPPSTSSRESLIPPWRWEVLLVDNGCLPSTKDVFHYHDNNYHYLNGANVDIHSTLRYIPLCNNTRYSVANNLAVNQYAARSSQWFLFLNDDVVPQQRGTPGTGGSFLWNFHALVAAHSRHTTRQQGRSQSQQSSIGAVGCKLLFGHHKIVEAGSVILASGKTDNYLRDADACENQGRHVRRTHYSSGACLFVQAAAFRRAGGFAEKLYEAYYEDTHLQMHLRHRQHLHVLYSPFSQALHVEHGTFGKTDSKILMDTSRETFLSSWAQELQTWHPATTLPKDSQAHGALSGHLLSKDDTTVFESDPQNHGIKSVRCLVVGTAMEVAIAAKMILSMQTTERYIITVLVLGYQDNVHSPPRVTSDDCLHGVSTTDLGDAFVRQQLGKGSGTSPSSAKLYSRVMRMLRMMGIEVLWESMIDDSHSGDSPTDDDVAPANMCMKDIDGCDCGPEFYKNKNIRTTLDHLLAERDGFFDAVFNLNTGMRATLKGDADVRDRIHLCPPEVASINNERRVTGN